jgi:toxin ParE1/3/4
LAAYALSRLARTDLFQIVDYALNAWGAEQAERYLDGLRDCLDQLSSSPGMGRPCERLRAGYRRFEHGKHVIFYRLDGQSIFISRILHERMLPDRRLIEDS